MAAAEDDESWLYGESIQDAKRIKEERQTSDDARDESNQDETSRVSRFSSDDLPAVPGNQDRSNTNSPTPSARQRDTTKRSLDDKEAGELSGEEEAAAASAAADKENKKGSGTEEANSREDAEEGDGADGADGADGDTAPPGTGGSDESDSDDDSVQVTIGDIKAGPPAYGYTGPPVNLNIKRGGVYQPSGVGGQSTGKGKGVDLESVGMINGVPTYEFNLDTMEDKPWRKPGADITDYFNYGFSEDTWKAYCDKQRKLRMEANGTLGGLPVGTKIHHAVKDQQIPIATVNENSKYADPLGKKAGPPPGRKISGSIDVIGASTTTSRRATLTAPKENVIQVVTADKREYSRKPFVDTGMPPPPPGVIPPGLPIFPDLSMPPPGMPPPGMPPPGMPPPGMPPPGMPPPGIPPYAEPFDAYNRSYPPPPGVPLDRPPPGFDNSFDGSYFNGNNSGQDPYNPFEPTGDGPWESRDGSRYHKKDWDYHGRNDRSPPRSPPNGEEYERGRHRDYRERTRDRSRDRDRDRERDRERERSEKPQRSERSEKHERSERSEKHERSDRDRERKSESRHRDRERESKSRTRDHEPEERRERDRSERGESERRSHKEHRDREEKHSRSSRRKHREETDESEHRSSRHKRKRSKREKEEEASTAGSSSAAAAAEANESQDAPTENQDADSGTE